MTPSNRHIPPWVFQVSEWIFALIGVIICIAVASVFGASQPGDLWPTPGFYFVEIIIFPVLAFVSYFVNLGPINNDRSIVAWVTGGMLLAFVILGGFSIGPFLFPAMLALWLSAGIHDIRTKRLVPRHLGLALVAAIFQAALIGVFLLVI